jgi:predicted GNAT family acetyltransferase
MCLRGAGAHAQTVHVDVRDNEAASRHEAVVDGDVLAFIDYKIESGRHWLVHTEIDPAHEGVGIGSYLVRSVLDSLRERGALIVPTCPFVAGWIRRHPDYSDLVDDAMLRQIKRERSAARRPAEADRAVDRCVHVPDEFARNTVPWPEHGCAECIAAGHRNWVHLRMCQFCGHVGCCDSSPGKHSSGHSELAQHPVIRSYEPGEDWWFCFIDNMTFELADAPPARSYSP